MLKNAQEGSSIPTKASPTVVAFNFSNLQILGARTLGYGLALVLLLEKYCFLAPLLIFPGARQCKNPSETAGRIVASPRRVLM